jgi:hypothetical protein
MATASKSARMSAPKVWTALPIEMRVGPIARLKEAQRYLRE